MSFRVRRRAVWTVAVAKSVSWLGDEVALIALTLRMQSGGAGAGAVAALFVANLLPVVLLSGPVGRLLDRHDNRSLLICSATAQALTCAALAFAGPSWLVLALMALLGAGQAVTGSAWQALVPVIAGRDGLPAATGLIQAGTTLAGIVAPAVGGALTGWFGARVPLLVDAASFVVVAAAALAVRATRGGGAGARVGVSALRIVSNDALLRPLFLLLAGFILLASMVNIADVFLVREVLGASTLWYGIAGAAFSVGMLLGVVCAGRLAGARRLATGLVAATAILSLGLAAMGAVPDVGWLLPASLVAGFGNGILNVTLSSLVMQRAADDERGRVAALLTGTTSGTSLVAFAAGGLLTGAIGARAVFLLAGCLGLVAPAVLGRTVIRAAASRQAPSAAVALPAAA